MEEWCSIPINTITTGFCNKNEALFVEEKMVEERKNALGEESVTKSVVENESHEQRLTEEELKEMEKQQKLIEMREQGLQQQKFFQELVIRTSQEAKSSQSTNSHDSIIVEEKKEVKGGEDFALLHAVQNAREELQAMTEKNLEPETTQPSKNPKKERKRKSSSTDKRKAAKKRGASSDLVTVAATDSAQNRDSTPAKGHQCDKLLSPPVNKKAKCGIHEITNGSPPQEFISEILLEPQVPESASTAPENSTEASLISMGQECETGNSILSGVLTTAADIASTNKSDASNEVSNAGPKNQKKKTVDLGLDGDYWATPTDTLRRRRKPTQLEISFSKKSPKPKPKKHDLTPEEEEKKQQQKLKQKEKAQKEHAEKVAVQELRIQKAKEERCGFLVIPGLFLGSKQAAHNEEWLEEAGVKYIVNCTSEVKNYYENAGITYKRIAIADSGSVPVGLYFKEVCTFIKEAINSGGKVLVHCKEGRSRAPTFVTAYLIGECGWKFEDANAHVEKIRGISLTTNYGFISALKELEQTLNTTLNKSTSQGLLP